MQQQFDNQIALFIRDERTGRYVFNAQALKAQSIRQKPGIGDTHSKTRADQPSFRRRKRLRLK